MGRMAYQAGGLALRGFSLGPLTFHITPHSFQRSATNTAYVISSMPKIWFPVKRFQVPGKAVPASAFCADTWSRTIGSLSEYTA